MNLVTETQTKAKRGRKVKEKDKTNLRHSYLHYRDSCAERGFKPVDCKTYLIVVCGMFKFIFMLVLKGYDIKLGGRLGNLGIRGERVNPRFIEVTNPLTGEKTEEIVGLAPAWGKTRKLWVKEAEKQGFSLKEYIQKTPREERPPLVLCFNEHSNGLRYRLYWYKKKSFITHIKYYSLILAEDNKQAIYKAALAGQDYLELTGFKRKTKKRNVSQKRQAS